MKRSGIVVILNSLVGRFGWMLIRTSEIDRMEKDASSSADYRKRLTIERDIGYFGGLSDYAGKKASQLRQRYTSNTSVCGSPLGASTQDRLVGGTIEGGR